MKKLPFQPKPLYLKWNKFLLLIIYSIVCSNIFAQVGISSTVITPDASSVLELRSTSSGFLPPRMTTTQRDAITSPATGLLVYNTTTNQLNYYNSGWQIVTAGGQTQLNGLGFIKANGTTISYDNSTYLTANQSITWTGGGDVSGSGNGSTSISPSLTITGLRGSALPALSSGFLKYNGSSWVFDNSSYITNANVVFNNQGNTYTAGSKQIFTANGTSADIRLTGTTTDPSTLSPGDIWYNTTSNIFKGRFNTTTRQLATLDGTEAFTNKNLTGAGNTFPTFNQNTTGQSGSVANPLTIGTNLQGTTGTYNGSTGVTISLQNAAADGSTKGAAGFNGTNFTSSAGIINTIQDITTTSTVQYGTMQLGTLSNAPATNWTIAGRQSANNRPTLVLQRQTNTTPTGDFISLYDAGITPAKLFNVDINGIITTGGYQGTAIADAYISSASTWNGKQSALSGTGFVKIAGTTISYDNSTYLTANQSITWTGGGDVSGSGSGSTSISPSLTITGLRGSALPALSSGFLKYNGSSWVFDNSSYITNANVVFNNQSNTYTAGFKQIFTANGISADIRLTGNTTDPSTLLPGDIWYNTTSNIFKGRFNTTTRQLATIDGTEAFTNKDLTGVGNTFPTFNQNTTGTSSNITGTVAIANGGSGQTTQQAAIDALTGTQSSGKYLRSDGTHSTLTTIQVSDVPTLNQNTTGTSSNVTGTVAIANGGTGQTTQQAAIDALTGTQSSGKYLRSDGTHSTLTTIQVSDVPTLNQNTTGSSGSISGTNVITNTNLSQMPTNTLKGNNTGSTANATDLTTTQVAAMLPVFTTSTNGLVPASGGGTDKYLRADGTFSYPVPGIAAMTAVSAAINTTETNLTSFTLPANLMTVGATFRIVVYGTCTSSAANASNIRVRLGTAGTSADAIVAVVTPTAQTSGTNIPFTATLMVTIRTIGTTGTAGGGGNLMNNGTTGISSITNVVTAPTSGVVVNTTVSNIIHVSYQSAAITTTATFQVATIEVVNN